MSESKTTTARANGAKSHGPITPEGKAKSALNSLRHGLSAKAIVLPSESQEDYEALRAAYQERFQPADQVELDLVESMAASRWRLRRVANIETHLLGAEIETRAAREAKGVAAGDVEEEDRQDNDQRLASAFRYGSAWFTTLTRYENSLNRTFDRALRQLQLLQKTRPLPPPANLQNEPKPVPPEPPSAPSPMPSAPPRAIVELGNTPPVPGVYAGLGADGLSPSKPLYLKFAGYGS
jgi:hypothetical protein